MQHNCRGRIFVDGLKIWARRADLSIGPEGKSTRSVEKIVRFGALIDNGRSKGFGKKSINLTVIFAYLTA